ncbi:hypothetical protein [Micromonospora sp. NPDC049102]|uniref:hypothetical protein n=1 Tax=Micromonospora sp. NPDC049102 TaxID=3364265 RepID=UPI00371BCF99
MNGGPPGSRDGQRAAQVRHGDAVDDLRDAWLATIAAADRAGAHPHGAGPPGRILPWQEAVTECWRALGLVYAGLAADGTAAASATAGELLAGLHAARVDADPAAALAARFGAGHTMVDCAPITGGGFATVWWVALDDGREVVLKVAPPTDAPLLRYERGLCGSGRSRRSASTTARPGTTSEPRSPRCTG